MARTPKTGAYLTPAMLVAALEARFPKKEYALLSQVRNGTGFSRTVRTADMIALSLWPSRGIHLHGFEIKAYRSDWKRERENPAKAEEIAQDRDYWWIVVTEAGVAPLDEVPVTWGLLAPDDTGKELVPLRQAPKLTPKPLTTGFVAALLRNASDAMVPASSLELKVREARDAGIKEGERSVKDVTDLERLRRVEQSLREFERVSGLSIDSGWQGDRAEYLAKLGAAVKTVIKADADIASRVRQLEYIAKHARETADVVERHLAALKMPLQSPEAAGS